MDYMDASTFTFRVLIQSDENWLRCGQIDLGARTIHPFCPLFPLRWNRYSQWHAVS